MKRKSPYLRYYYLVKWIEDKHYPSMRNIIQWFDDKGISIIDRTFYRDTNALKNLYNIPIEYCKKNRGYFVDAENESYHETERFLQLMQEMITAQSVSDLFTENSKYLTYLEFENEPSLLYLNIFEELLEAIQKKVRIKFQHFSYQKNMIGAYQVKPLFLKQYQNRWYLMALHDNKYKAFAVERIKELEITNTKFTESIDKIKPLFLQIIGLTYSQEQQIEEVVLKFHPSQKGYIQSVPIHKLQQQIADTDQEYTIGFYVRPNFELKQQILKYGALVQVVKPLALRNEVKKEHQAALKLYK